MIGFLRDGGETWQKFQGFDDDREGGVLGVLIDGVTEFTGDTLVSGETDYTGFVTASGLSGIHTYQMMLDGVASGDIVSFKVMPASGEDITFLAIGDLYLDPRLGLTSMLASEEPGEIDFVIASELFYPDDNVLGGDGGTTLYTDGTSDNLSTASNQEEYLLRLNQYTDGNSPVGIHVKYRDGLGIDPTLHPLRNSSTMKQLHQTFKVWSIPDNHEMALIGSGNSQIGQVKFDAMFKAFQNYQGGYPQASDTDVDSEPDPLLYWDKVVGDIHIITLDTQTYNDATEDRALDADVTGDTTQGDNKQNAWFRRTLANSAANYIIVCMAGGPVLNAITEPGFTGEWQGADGLFEFIDGINKTVIFLSWDLHNFHARLITEDSSTNDGILDINSGPLWDTGGAGSYIDQYGEASSETVYHNFAEHPTTMASTATAGAATISVTDNVGFETGKNIIITPDTGELAREFISGIAGTGPYTLTLTDGSLQRTATAGNRVNFGQYDTEADLLSDPPSGKANYLKVERTSEYLDIKVIQTGYGRIFWHCRVNKGKRIPVLFKSNSSFVDIGNE